MNILLGITGSVATTLTQKIYDKLVEKGHEVRIVATNSSLYFLDDFTLINSLYLDKDEFPTNKHWGINKTITHIELRDWSDLFLICPCSANTLGKMANGICDNLLTSIFRAWDLTKKPIYICPAMNTNMYLHPSTAEQIIKLKSFPNVNFIAPTVKKLECGQFGIGALADINSIIDIALEEKWEYPLLLNSNKYIPKFRNKYIPQFPHPGAFGAIRKHDIHTGVDLYCELYTQVDACQDGVIVDISQFTGKDVGSPWWKDTWSISVEGRSGIICYGEIDINKKLKVGDKVSKWDALGVVIPVLNSKPNRQIENHRMQMLHIELMKKGSKDYCCPLNGWTVDGDRPKELLDPTPYLDNAL
jgi:phosphopantothenoylcysteine decarboxylase